MFKLIMPILKMYATGLIAACLLISSAFINEHSDTPMFISMISVAVALPFLAGSLFAINVTEVLPSLEDTIKDVPPKTFIIIGISFYGGLIAGMVAITSALWHFNWLIGLLFLICSCVSTTIYGSNVQLYWRKAITKHTEVDSDK